MLVNDLVEFQFDGDLLEIHGERLTIVGAKVVKDEFQFLNIADFVHDLCLNLIEIVREMLKQRMLSIEQKTRPTSITA